MTAETQDAVTDLTSLTVKYLLDPFTATEATVRVIGALIAEMRRGDPYALKLANQIREIKKDIWIPDWQTIISGQCMGITQRGARCGRTIPGDTHHDTAVFWLCAQHMHQASGVWIQLERFFQSASVLANRKQGLVDSLARLEETEHVYFMTDGRYLKIGKSIDPENRLKSLRAESRRGKGATIIPDTLDEESLQIILTIPGGTRMERKMQMLCHDFHYVGEWFHYNPQLIQHLKGVGINLDLRKLDDRSVGLEVV